MVVLAREPQRKLRARGGGLPGLHCGTASEYTEYVFSVRRQDVEWIVQLRFSDFVAFDSLIRRNFEPHELAGIESLPQRTFFSRNDSERLIQERKVRLESYLNSLTFSRAVMESGALKNLLAFPDDAFPDEGFEALEPRTGEVVGVSAYAICQACNTVLRPDNADDLDSGRCSVCFRRALSIAL